MENNPDTNTEVNHSDNNGNINEQTDVEYNPKLFSEENYKEELSSYDEEKNISSQKLFDQDSKEDEDFEIPAFLRRQKF